MGGASGLVCLVNSALALSAHADPREKPPPRATLAAPSGESIDLGLAPTVMPHATFRPHAVAEFGIGMLTLPGAAVCVSPDEACTTGDTSFQANAWPLFRVSPTFSVGAGLSLALTRTADSPIQQSPDLAREHFRRYMTVETTVRHYPLITDNFEGWVGLTSGIVIIGDTFETSQGDQSQTLVGPSGATLITEGFTAGLSAGLQFFLGDELYAGGTIRTGRWFLPEDPARTPFGDEASLQSNVNMVDLGLSLGVVFH